MYEEVRERLEALLQQSGVQTDSWGCMSGGDGYDLGLQVHMVALYPIISSAKRTEESTRARQVMRYLGIRCDAMRAARGHREGFG